MTVSKIPDMADHWQTELRASLGVGNLTLSLAQSDAALQCKSMPNSLSDLHPDERKKYQDAAVMALMSVNIDAELFAQRQGEYVGWELFEDFCKDEGLDWCGDSHPINREDKLEICVSYIGRRAIRRFREVLACTYPGLSRHLLKLQKERTGVQP